uniref:Uncharacterized protein n=1 Tax=Cacopsylla melanoneura TaxID=428564 RepID=A0A8D8UHL0_9HEMI
MTWSRTYHSALWNQSMHEAYANIILSFQVRSSPPAGSSSGKGSASDSRRGVAEVRRTIPIRHSVRSMTFIVVLGFEGVAPGVSCEKTNKKFCQNMGFLFCLEN